MPSGPATDDEVRATERVRRALIGLASFLAITAAVLFALFAWAIYEIACDEGCSSPRPERTWLLVLAVVAIAPVIGGARFLLLRRKGAAFGLFAVALALYAAWGVLLATS